MLAAGTTYPSPWPAAIATMVAALLVGGGTVGGVLWTVKNARTNAAADREAESGERQKDRDEERSNRQLDRSTTLDTIKLTLEDAQQSRIEEARRQTRQALLDVIVDSWSKYDLDTTRYVKFLDAIARDKKPRLSIDETLDMRDEMSQMIFRLILVVESQELKRKLTDLYQLTLDLPDRMKKAALPTAADGDREYLGEYWRMHHQVSDLISKEIR